MKDAILKVNNFIKKYNFLFSVGAIFAISLLFICFSLSGLKNYYYGNNLSFYINLEAYYNNLANIISSPNLLGILIAKVLCIISNGNMVLLSVINYFLYLSSTLILYLISRKISNNPLWSLVSTLLYALSLPSICGVFLIESIPTTISLLFLALGFYFYFSKDNKNRFVLTCIFLTLYLLSSSFSCLLLPLFFIEYDRIEKTRKNKIAFISLCSLSIICSITSFIHYDGNSKTYFGYIITGLLNVISIPFTYVNDYVLTMNSFDYYMKTIIVAIGIVYLYYMLLIVAVFASTHIRNNNVFDAKARTLTLVSLSIVLYIFLMGFVRRASLFNLLVPLFIFNLFAPRIINNNDQKHKIIIPGILSTASLISSIIVTITIINTYVEPNISYTNADLESIKSYSSSNKLFYVGSSFNTKKLEYYSNLLDKEDSIETIDVENKPALSLDEFEKHDYYTDYKGTSKIGKGISVGGDWNEGAVFDTTFYTTDSHILFEYYSPDYYPTNTLRIYINEKLIKKDWNWKGYSNAEIKLNEGGSFVHIRVEAENVYMPHSLDPTIPDMRRLAFMIVNLRAN